MNEPLTLLLAAATGLILGGIFFGGLWWTVRRGVSSKWPALLFLTSLLLRTGIVIAGFYLVGRDNWVSMLVCLLGFIIARQFMLRLGRPLEESPHAT